MHDVIKDAVSANEQRFLDELFALLRIPSVSAQPAHKGDMRTMAETLASRFSELGLEVEILETPGYPVVYAEKIVDPSKPTILVYGHYDVQPAEPLELWKSEAFEPDVRDGRIYARGACDDKGQMYMHAKAVDILNQTGGLPCNVKFFIEGEEEVGSEHLEEAILTYKDKLACDVIAISDTSMIANEVPSITVGLRGIAYLEVHVYGPKIDLHSGAYGGPVGNPINTLCEILASLKDADGHITIPGFYDDMDEVSDEARAEIAKIPFDEAAYKKYLNVNGLYPETGYTPLEQLSIRPTLDINGMWGGYTGEGSKTVLPSEAHAKVSMRLVPGQDPDKIAALFTEHIKAIAPDWVRVEVVPHHGGEPFLTDTSSSAYQAAARAYRTSFGKAPIASRDGGSIPITALFQRTLEAPVVLMGFGLNEDAIHSPNESFGVFNYLKGIETISLFHHYLAEGQN